MLDDYGVEFLKEGDPPHKTNQPKSLFEQLIDQQGFLAENSATDRSRALPRE